MICGVVNALGTYRYGPAGKMLMQEREYVVNGLTGTMASLPSEVVQKINDLSAPVMALTGLLMYSYRLANLEAAKRQEERHVAAANRVMRTPPNPPANGEVQPTQPTTPPNLTVPTKDDLLNMQGRTN
jgi:hypothetical protein